VGHTTGLGQRAGLGLAGLPGPRAPLRPPRPLLRVIWFVVSVAVTLVCGGRRGVGCAAAARGAGAAGRAGARGPAGAAPSSSSPLRSLWLVAGVAVAVVGPGRAGRVHCPAPASHATPAVACECQPFGDSSSRRAHPCAVWCHLNAPCCQTTADLRPSASSLRLAFKVQDKEKGTWPPSWLASPPPS
jgi:hypothetical protein